MDHYFAHLWQFGQVHAGRTSLLGQRRLNGTGPAIAFLDDMIEWHVTEWAGRWLELRTQMEGHVGTVDDPHSLRSFCDLVDQVDYGNAHVPPIRALINERLSQR